MISELFFSGKLKEIKNEEIYEQEFVRFYLNVHLIGVHFFDKSKVEELLEKMYGKANIKNNAILKFCENNFISFEKKYKLNIPEDEKEVYQYVIEYKKEMENDEVIQKHFILNKEILDINLPFHVKLKKCIGYYQLKSNVTFEKRMISLYSYYNILKNYYKYYREIDDKLEKIPQLFNLIEITELEITEQQFDFLIDNNIFTLRGLKKIPINSLICIFCNNIKKFANEIGKFAYSKEILIDKLEKIFNENLKEEWINVLRKRFDFHNKRQTLAEIGKELNLSRQRIKQIEDRATGKLLQVSNNLNELLFCFYKDINKQDYSFITIEEFTSYIGNSNVLIFLILVMANSKSTRIVYNDEYGIIYDQKEFKPEELLEEAYNQMQDIIFVSEKENYNKIQKWILDNEYRIHQNKILIRKGISTNTIYMTEIEENFDSGYNISSIEDYNKLIKILNEKYGDIQIPSMHSIQAMMDRYDFLQIDRGTYKAKKYIVGLTEELSDEIINFIIKNAPIVSYSLIFEKFEKKLETFGIDNRFYLKGVLDEKLPQEFDTGRDFINISSEKNITIYDVMHEVFNSFEEEFTIEDVKEKIPGLKEYNYESYAKTEESNGLISIAPKTYVYIDKLNITKDIEKELKEYIDNLFKKLDSKILTSKKIYANLSIMNKELLGKLNIKSRYSDFELFSIIKYLYKDDYYYSRPIISLDDNLGISTELLIKEYVKKFNKFNYNDIKNYIYKMNLGILYSYLNFMEDLSDEYIQVSKDGMMKIEDFKISQKQLEDIKKIIDILTKNDALYTENFEGYFMLPDIGRVWNKYLLIGIIRSFFKDEYQIENTTNFYVTTDFIVRRI